MPNLSMFFMPLSCVAVMPAYNEEGNIDRVVADWTRELDRLFGDSYRLVVINDGSRDTTGNLLDMLAGKYSRLIVHHQVNQGHGNTVMNGYKLAVEMDTAYIFQTDSDDQFEATDFSKLWDRRHESKFILGFRQVRHDSVYRLWLSKTAVFLVMTLFSIRLKDSNVPYRLMEREFLKQLLPMIPKGAFAPNICLSILAARHKQPLLHIPVTHRQRVSGTAIVSKALIKGCIKSLGDLFRLRATL